MSVFQTVNIDDPYERVIDALRGRGGRLQTRRDGSVRATCPAHADLKPSLVVTRRDDRVLMRCFAGCRTSDVVLALGLRMADLFSNTRTSRVRPREVAAYNYCDLNGVIDAEKVRFEPKAFRWRVPVDTPGGGFKWGLHGATPGLYRLPDLVDVKRVLVTEGERATDRLWDLGLPATCPPAGAGVWRPEWSITLWHVGCREAIVLADSDRSGREHAARVAGACYAVAACPTEAPSASDVPWTTWTTTTSNVLDAETAVMKVKLIELPTVPGGDVYDWLAAGHTALDLTAVIDGAPYWTPHGAERERADRKRSLTRDRVRRHRERRRAERLRSVAATQRTYSGTMRPVTRNAVTHPERTSRYITNVCSVRRAA